jgi:hypothetical protein
VDGKAGSEYHQQTEAAPSLADVGRSVRMQLD